MIQFFALNGLLIELSIPNEALDCQGQNTEPASNRAGADKSWEKGRLCTESGQNTKIPKGIDWLSGEGQT